MSASLPTFRILAPEFAATGDTAVEDVIGIVTLWIDKPVFGARASEAIARLAAHELTMQGRVAATAGTAGTAGVGGVTAQKAGDLSLSFGSSAFSKSLDNEDDNFRQTTHGLAYLQIRDSRAETGLGLLT